jgi:hypothetical protein
MAKDIAWRALKKLVPKVWIHTKNETDLRIELINGSTIELKGTENAMALAWPQFERCSAGRSGIYGFRGLV